MDHEMHGAAPTPENHLTPEDRSNLDSLAIAHYICGGLGAFLSLFPLIHVGIGIAIVTGSFEVEDAPAMFGWIFIGAGLVFVVIGEAVSIALIFSGRHLKQRTGYMFSFVLACIACINVPVGTVLGILTIIVLSRPTVKAAYGRTA